MRKIESEMIRAIRQRREWSKGNTRVARAVASPQCMDVYLHGNHIATVSPTGAVCPNYHTFAEWPTPTTRSRLVALGVNASIKDFEACIDGEPV